MVECPICDKPMKDLPSVEPNKYYGCNYCKCIWISTEGNPVMRRMEDHEALQKNKDGKYYLRDQYGKLENG